MTRVAGFTVTLAEDIREEAVEAIVNAIRMVKGVASVEPLVASYELHIAQMRADTAWRERLLQLARNGVGAENEGR